MVVISSVPFNPMVTFPRLEHFHFYSVQGTSAKSGFSWGKAASGAVALYTPEVKML
jgi:hypothetical protein